MTSQPAAEAPAAAAAAAEQAPAPRGVVEAPVRPDVAAAAAAAQAYGAAAVSLIDPACKPGTPQFASAKAQMDQLLQKYRDRVAQLAAAGVSTCNRCPETGCCAGMGALHTCRWLLDTAPHDAPALALARS
jgi:hypothetical protein